MLSGTIETVLCRTSFGKDNVGEMSCHVFMSVDLMAP
jgi:hypothetical protein